MRKKFPTTFKSGVFLRSDYISEIFTPLGHFYQVEGTFFDHPMYNFKISENYYCHMFFKRTKHMKFYDSQKLSKLLVFYMIAKLFLIQIFSKWPNTWNFMVSKNHQNYLFFYMIKHLLSFHDFKKSIKTVYF